MSKIKIKNFGPIKGGLGDDWIDIKKVTVLIGNQGSGKSTVAKLISTFSWIEKALYKQGIKKEDVKRKSKFENYYCEYQNLKNYFKNDSEIEFEGDSFKFTYKRGRLSIDETKGGKYLVPKIMYVPAERNFVSAVSQPEKLKYLPKTLYTFLEEYERSKEELSDNLDIPINNLKFQHDNRKGESKIIGEDYDLPLYQASSGLQSAIPLFLVSKNLSEGIDRASDNSKSKISLEEMQKLRDRILMILRNEKLTDDLMRSQAVELLSSITKNDCFINIVEEPEQNLFPLSQWEMLKKLLEFSNFNQGNKLIMTTHSPYLINYISIAIQAEYLKNKIEENINATVLINKIEKIISQKALVSASDVVVYQLDETNGIIKKLPTTEGIPSDNNYLNESLRHCNEMFDNLLEIEQEL